ncbi:MAG: hypothetical protein ACHP9Y_00505 [Gammaproteobacteria bacterium]
MSKLAQDLLQALQREIPSDFARLTPEYYYAEALKSPYLRNLNAFLQNVLDFDQKLNSTDENPSFTRKIINKYLPGVRFEAGTRYIIPDLSPYNNEITLLMKQTNPSSLDILRLLKLHQLITANTESAKSLVGYALFHAQYISLQNELSSLTSPDLIRVEAEKAYLALDTSAQEKYKYLLFKDDAISVTEQTQLSRYISELNELKQKVKGHTATRLDVLKLFKLESILSRVKDTTGNYIKSPKRAEYVFIPNLYRQLEEDLVAVKDQPLRIIIELNKAYKSLRVQDEDYSKYMENLNAYTKDALKSYEECAKTHLTARKHQLRMANPQIAIEVLGNVQDDDVISKLERFLDQGGPLLVNTPKPELILATYIDEIEQLEDKFKNDKLPTLQILRLFKLKKILNASASPYDYGLLALQYQQIEKQLAALADKPLDIIIELADTYYALNPNDRNTKGHYINFIANLHEHAKDTLEELRTACASTLDSTLKNQALAKYNVINELHTTVTETTSFPVSQLRNFRNTYIKHERIFKDKSFSAFILSISNAFKSLFEKMGLMEKTQNIVISNKNVVVVHSFTYSGSDKSRSNSRRNSLSEPAHPSPQLTCPQQQLQSSPSPSTTCTPVSH